MPEWTTPHDWTTGEEMTTAKLNQVRDQLNHLFSEASLTAFDYPYTIDPRLTAANASVGTANTCHYNRIYHGGSISLFYIYVAVSNGTIGCAVYDHTGTGISAVPNTRTATSGSIACPAAGIATVSLGATVTVGHGTHSFALSASDTTATFASAAAVPTQWHVGARVQATAHPPPTTATLGSGVAQAFVIIGA